MKFGRNSSFLALTGAIAAIKQMWGDNVAAMQAALTALPQYKSRGKGKGGGFRSSGVPHMVSVRAARKAKNVKRNRLAHR